MIRLLLLLLSLTPLLAHATIYKWVDDDGKIHFSQTPPPDRDTRKEVVGHRASLTEQDIDPAYCGAVQRFAMSVAQNMRRGVDVNAMNAHLRGVDEEVKEALGTNEPVVRQIVFAVYGYRPSDLSPSSIGRLIQQNCMNGNFSGGREARHQASRSRGTGWPVTSSVVVTNHHVVAEARRYALVLPSGTRLDAELLAADDDNDIALLRVKNDAHRFSPIALDTRPSPVGTDVFTVGYPHPDVMGSEAKLTRGIVNALSGYRNDPRTYQISVPLQAGNSGGPLVTLGGQVVGVVTAKLSAMKMLKDTGDLPQNVNYAIKSRYVRALLEKSGIHDFRDEWAAPAPALADAARPVKAQVVLVVAD